MDNIIVVTSDTNSKQTIIKSTVDELIYAWYHDIDIPTNDDTVISCVLDHTHLHFETFGDLLEVLTGDAIKDV